MARAGATQDGEAGAVEASFALSDLRNAQAEEEALIGARQQRHDSAAARTSTHAEPKGRDGVEEAAPGKLTDSGI